MPDILTLLFNSSIKNIITSFGRVCVHKTQASQSLFRIILSAGSQELTDLSPSMKLESLPLSSPAFMGMCCIVTGSFYPPLELERVSEKIINCTQWGGQGKDEGGFVGKEDVSAITPANCTGYTARCFPTSLHRLKQKRLERKRSWFVGGFRRCWWSFTKWTLGSEGIFSGAVESFRSNKQRCCHSVWYNEILILVLMDLDP